MDRLRRAAGLLAALLLAGSLARAAGVAASAHGSKPPVSAVAVSGWTDALAAFLRRPQPRLSVLAPLLKGLPGLDLGDPATRQALEPLADEARAGALALLEQLASLSSPEALDAVAAKLALLDHPVMRALIGDEGLSRRVSQAAAARRSRKALAFAEGIAASLGKTPVILYVSLKGNAPPEKLARAAWLPPIPLRGVAAKTKAELREGLGKALAAHEEVSHLIVEGHGASESSGAEATLELVLADDDDVRLKVPAVERRPLDLALPENQEAFLLFAGLRGKMADGAKAFLGQCDLLNGDAAAAANKGSALLDLLGLKEGELYANRVAGVSPWRLAGFQAVKWTGLALSAAMTLASAAVIVAEAAVPPVEAGSLVFFALCLGFGILGFRLLVGSVNRGYRVAKRGGRVTLEKTTLARFLETFA